MLGSLNHAAIAYKKTKRILALYISDVVAILSLYVILVILLKAV